MASLTSQLLVRLIDGVSGPARAASASLRGIGAAAKAASGGGGVIGLQQRLGAAIEANNRAIDNMRGRMMDAVGGFLALRGAISGTVGLAMRFEDAMADVGKVSDFDAAGLAAYGSKLRAMASSDIPLAVDQLAALSAAAAASGIADADLEAFTRMTAKTAVAWELTGAQAGEALAKIKTQLGLTVRDTELLGDAINHLSDNTASTAPDLIEFTKRVAAQGEFFGFTKEQTLAFGAAMVSAGAQSDVAATSFRNMGRALGKGSMATKGQRAAYKALGLDAVKVSKAMQKDAMGTTLTVMERLAQLPRHAQGTMASALFGDEARGLVPLLGDIKLLREAYAHVADEAKYAGSVNREFAVRSSTTSNALQLFKNRLSEIGLTFGSMFLPAIKDALGVLGPFALQAARLAERFPVLTKAAIFTIGGLMGLRVALIGVQWAALMAKGGLLSMLLPFVRIGAAARAAAAGNIAYQASLAAMAGTNLSGMAAITAGLTGMLRAIPGVALLGTALKAVGAAIAAIGGAISAPVVAVLAAIAAAGFLIFKYWGRISSVMSGVGRAIGEQLAPALEVARPLLSWLAPVGDAIASAWGAAVSALKSFGDWIGAFFGREVLSDAQKTEWEHAGYQVATAMIEAVKSKIGELVTWFSTLPSRIVAAIGRIDIGSLIKWPSMPSWLGGGGGSAPAQSVPGRASGGHVGRGQTYLVGERRPELFTPSRDGYVHSRVPQGSSGGGGPVTVNQVFNVSGQTDPERFVATVKDALRRDLQMGLRGTMADTGLGFA